jgi:hypothetical protein
LNGIAINTALASQCLKNPPALIPAPHDTGERYDLIVVGASAVPLPRISTARIADRAAAFICSTTTTRAPHERRHSEIDQASWITRPAAALRNDVEQSASCYAARVVTRA